GATADRQSAATLHKQVAHSHSTRSPLQPSALVEEHAKTQLHLTRQSSRSGVNPSLPASASLPQLTPERLTTTTKNKHAPGSLPFLYAPSTGEASAVSLDQLSSCLVGDSCISSQCGGDPSPATSSAGSEAARPLFFQHARMGTTIQRAQGQAASSRRSYGIQGEAVSRDPEQLRACGGQIWSPGVGLVTDTQRERAGESPVEHPRGVHRGGGAGVPEAVAPLHATQRAFRAVSAGRPPLHLPTATSRPDNRMPPGRACKRLHAHAPAQLSHATARSHQCVSTSAPASGLEPISAAHSCQHAPDRSLWRQPARTQGI